MPQFYAYMWLRENDGTPWYVGKGSGNRAYQRSLNHWAPTNRALILILNRSSEQEAFNTEIKLIRNWGRKDLGTGCLYNYTNGGDGASAGNQYLLGYHHTSESKQKVSRALRGVKKSAETRAKMKASWTPERRLQRAQEMRARETAKFLKTVAWG